MILHLDPGEPWEYPIFGLVVVHHKTQKIIATVSQPVESSSDGYQYYGTIYAGVYWWVGVALPRNREFEKTSLQQDGHMPFHSVPYNKLGVIKYAAKLLQNTDR